jgi:hypothetical protein
MDGYSEIGAIFFSIAGKTSYAKHEDLAGLWRSRQDTEAFPRQDFYKLAPLDQNSLEFLVPDYTRRRAAVKGRLISTGTYQGSPPYKVIKGPFPKILRQYHAAEHQVYNCFMDKIKRLPADSSLVELAAHIPSLEETRRAGSFSGFCASTFAFYSGFLLIITALPNLFHYQNHSLVFMGLWFLVSICVSSLICFFIQRWFFLSEPNDEQLLLAIEALKEVLKNESVIN